MKFMPKVRLILMLLLASVCHGAQVIRYVDPDAAGGGTGVDWANAYTSLEAWDTGEATNLVTDGDYHTVYCRSSGGTADTTPLVMGNWTTDSTHYIEIIGSDFPADGIYDSSAYRLEVTNAHAIDVNRDGRIFFRNLQIQLTATSGTYSAIYMWGAASEYYWTIDSCIIKGVCSGTGGAYGLRIFNGSGVATVYNTLIYDFVSGADNGFNGLRNDTGTINIYNSTVYNCYYGLATATYPTNLYNCAIGNCTDDLNGAGANADYCCTDDGDGTNGQGPSGGSWANEFTNTAGADFSLLSGGNCVGNGTDDPGSGLYSDDIIGTARSSTWDIGAFEYSAAPPAGGGAQLIIIGMD